MAAMTKAEVVEHSTAMNNCYTRIVTSLMDLDVLMGEVDERCTDEQAKARMSEVYRRANRLQRRGAEV